VGVRFSVPVQTGPGAHPAYCTMNTRLFPWHGIKHPPLSSEYVKERVKLFLYSPSMSSWQVTGRVSLAVVKIKVWLEQTVRNESLLENYDSESEHLRNVYKIQDATRHRKQT
jgi:hypothetical protein